MKYTKGGRYSFKLNGMIGEQRLTCCIIFKNGKITFKSRPDSKTPIHLTEGLLAGQKINKVSKIP